MKLLKKPTVKDDGVETRHFPYLLDKEFQEKRNSVYEGFTPARNASNKLCRGLRWGIFANDNVEWFSKQEYRLNTVLNPDEAGRTRHMDLIPEEFLRTPEMEQLIRTAFEIYHPKDSTFQQPYIVQISGIRYEPSLDKACYPSPDQPHQDGFDNAIFVLDKTNNILGGMSRIYTLDDEPMFEVTLNPGDGLFVKDKLWKHQVSAMLVSTDSSVFDSCCYRDIIIIRLDPAHR